jgi:hypothetical protein
MDDNLRIWRSFQVGSLFDLIMLDTRQDDRSITDLCKLLPCHINWFSHASNKHRRSLEIH